MFLGEFEKRKIFLSYSAAVWRLTMLASTVENGDGTPPDYFSLRQVELRILGEPQPRLRYYVQGLYKTHNYSPTDNQFFL